MVLIDLIWEGNYMLHFQKTVLSSAITAAVLLLGGCVVTPTHVVHHTRTQTTANEAAANVEYYQSAPPAEHNEVITVSPGLGYVWVPGVWYWSGNRYVWRAGTWQRPPTGYRTYIRGTWVHTPGRGWYHSGGYWR